MARILVTGSTQGIGAHTAKELIAQGHNVVVHARSEERREAAAKANPRASAVVIGDFASLESTRTFADAVSEQGKYDAVIHNAALGPGRESRHETVDGIEQVFQVNVVAPYLLTCAMPLPRRLVYVGSDAAKHGEAALHDVNWTGREWDGGQAYADSKLYLEMLTIEVAERYPKVVTNVVHPGWVRTSMGGPNAPKVVSEGCDSLVWLATSEDLVARNSGQYVYERETAPMNPQAYDPALRAELIGLLQDITGEKLPKKHRR